MKYIILAGGTYTDFETPKQLLKVNGERIIDRTIRLLKENGIENIYISSNNPEFDTCEATRIEHENNYITDDNSWWLDAFYPVQEPVCYIWGDVYFSEEAIKTIVKYKTDKDVLFGTSDAKNEQHENWGEPFAYIVNDYNSFFNAIKELKLLWKDNKLKRTPIVWEVYRYLHNLDVNIQAITDDYVCIDDGTIDIDRPEDINRVGNFK